MAYERRNMLQEIEHIYVMHTVLAVYIGLDTLPGTGCGMYLRAFTKLRRLLASSCMCVRLYAWNNWSPIVRIFMKFVI